MDPKQVPIVNIGHIAFQMKNAEEMLRFYTEVLGMKKLFTLTLADLIKARRSRNKDSASEIPFPVDAENTPWIEYLKLSDRQYLELFHDLGENDTIVENRGDYYGFQKVNYEVDDIQETYDRLVKAGVTIKQGIHAVMTGGIEFAALDPDGNEIQFTQYGDSVIPVKEDHRIACSPMKYTTQVALQIQHPEAMRKFYCEGLGLKSVYTVNFGHLVRYLEHDPNADSKMVAGFKQIADQPLIDFLEVAPHQYIEFFYTATQPKKEVKELKSSYGYRHLCLEVADVHIAWDAVTHNGIQPFTEITVGGAGSAQFWIEDPDGNQMELMEYIPGAKQLL